MYEALLFSAIILSGSRRIRGRLRFPAAETSIHTSRISWITVQGRVVYADLPALGGNFTKKWRYLV